MRFSLVLSLLCCLTGAAHAAPASHPATAHKAYLSLIIDDLGQNLPRDRRVLGLPGPVTTAANSPLRLPSQARCRVAST